MKNILISGGAGYLGTVLAQYLLKKNYVTIYDSLYFPWLKNNKKKIKNSHRLKFINKFVLNCVKGFFIFLLSKLSKWF